MITVLLNGGLGNQLFQYAAGRALAEKHGVELFLDLSRLQHPKPGDTPRCFELAPFNIKASLLAEENRQPLGNYQACLHRLVLKAGIPLLGNIILKEQGCGFDPLISRAPSSCVLDGFWQSERYFKQITGLLQQELSLNSPSPALRKASSVLSDATVAVHVRRGDYVTNPAAASFHGICSQDYYRAAVTNILTCYPDSQFLVFSDDPAWCQEHLDLGQPFRLAVDMGVNGPAEELVLISRCAHQVIANSSFSWWGAWLNPSPHKLVVAPCRWFTDPAITTNDLVPETWVRLP
ncbi:alpha-1,2-fucosyltransferase [Trichlorobacter lovleyi]|uniref:alpha-1,2-fucosyltransferase n=1 Tax=Trichlorobacter lovleyi TaxID=313985 RepID=UPI0022406301|nr:alpha-1,2-fucosyltransferase [Trichlorobacter lovleyi]QOX79704.1 alpha-1,2-fucosyltransferase [Trichlorobacter lovleyi]